MQIENLVGLRDSEIPIHEITRQKQTHFLEMIAKCRTKLSAVEKTFQRPIDHVVRAELMNGQLPNDGKVCDTTIVCRIGHAGRRQNPSDVFSSDVIGAKSALIDDILEDAWANSAFGVNSFARFPACAHKDISEVDVTLLRKLANLTAQVIESGTEQLSCKFFRGPRGGTDLRCDDQAVRIHPANCTPPNDTCQVAPRQHSATRTIRLTASH